ncbi:methyltransferase domain-containing protein [Nocardioides piscis]|uniref:Class I SAM-dependent methyltransferase n=1 Tax=Nocardioides piscis TaxID=2714938 RepID=A0A6G7YEP8_9ACTN|nr:class I SAM-dependent methyltransferase [Nocardioides piscis]QIK75240.1 class I SAM-dependent methyltransferase [Nocardioides piscis]
MKQHATGRLADIGCGAVPLYGAYGDLTDSVTCIDWPSSFYTNKHVDIEHDLTMPLDLPDASFDTILCTDVLEHLPRPEVAMADFARLLAPRGKLIIGVPFLYGLHEEPHDHHRFTHFKLHDLAKSNALEVVTLETLGGPVEVVGDMVARLLASRGRSGRALAAAEQEAVIWLGRQLPASLRSDMDWKFPSGYLMVAQKPAQRPLQD